MIVSITAAALLFFLPLPFSAQNPKPTFSGLQLSLNGPAPNTEYTAAVIIHFGKLSPIGYPIAGGDFSGRQARELSMYQADLQVNKSVTYEFTPASGGNSERSHPNATLAVRVVSPASWQLSVSAQVNGDPSVTVDQLSFKEDAQTAYIPFTLHPQPAGSGPAGTFLLFCDLALRVDSDDRPGSYSWSITYTLSAY